ncbi:MAG: 1-acyl-sn-glycerol-3-phosphate acyltransferase [Bradymonadia bacterium]
MTIAADGLEPLTHTEFAQTMRRVGAAMSRYFSATAVGLDNLDGLAGAVLVLNHGHFMFGNVILAERIFVHNNRVVRGAADHLFFEVPVLRGVARRHGAVPGTRDSAARVLADGQLLIVLPGGAREGLGAASERYKLDWGTNRGFAVVAKAAGVPIIPVGGIGVDDLYWQVDRTRRSATVRAGLDLIGVSPRYVPPLYFGVGALPLPERMTFHIGAPIATDELEVDELVERTGFEVEALLVAGLQRRADEERLLHRFSPRRVLARLRQGTRQQS